MCTTLYKYVVLLEVSATTGSILMFTASEHLPERPRFLFVFVTFPFAERLGISLLQYRAEFPIEFTLAVSHMYPASHFQYYLNVT